MPRRSHKTKPWQRNRNPSGSTQRMQSHWLQEGPLGQEHLFADLDPYLFVLDQAICTEASRIAHRVIADRAEEMPTALIVPPSDDLTWHLGHIAQRFQIFLWAGTYNEILNNAAEHFDAEMFSGEIPESIEALDLILFLDANWPNPRVFLAEVEESCAHLNSFGSALFVLHSRGNSAALEFTWGDGSALPCAELLPTLPADLSPELLTSPIGNTHAEREAKVTTFLKRHREYFGKNSRDFCLNRLRDSDFQVASPPLKNKELSATLLILRGEGQTGAP